MLAAVFRNLYAAVPAEFKDYVEDSFISMAQEKMEMHYTSFVKFCSMYGLSIPLDVGTMSRYANEKILKAFNHIKKDQDTSFYIELAVELEIAAAKEYEEALFSFEKQDDYEDFGNLKGLILKNYSDEFELIDSLQILAYNNQD